MKIGILWENFEFGGVTSHLENLLNNKAFKNYEFTIFTNKTNKAVQILRKRLNNSKIKFEYFNSLNVIFFNNLIFKTLFFLLRPLLFIFSIFQFYFMLKKFKFDILLSECGGYGDFRSEISGILASRFLNFPVKILLIHHSYTKPFLWNFLLRIIDVFVKKSIDGLIFVSKATKNNIYQNTFLSSSNIKGKVIYNGVKISKKKKFDKKLDKLIISDGKLKLGMLSRIEPNKGQEILIDIFSELPKEKKKKVKIYFIGNGSKKYIEKLKIKLKNFKIHNKFEFTGYVNIESSIILKKLDLLVSLTKDFEGFGLSLAESLSVNTPVLATKVGAVKEFLNNKNSILIEPNNKKQLKSAILKFVKNPKKYKHQGILGGKLIKRSFNSEKMAQNYKIFFKECVKNQIKLNQNKQT